MAKFGADIVATDISQSQIDEAIRLSAEFNNIQYHVVSAEDLVLPEDSFDCITACQCF